MINKLTKKQEEGIYEWQQHCLKIGRDTSPVNKELVQKSWNKFYEILGYKTPKYWYCQSPLQAQIIINIFPEIQKIVKDLSDLDFKKGSNIRSNIGSNILGNIGENIWSNIRSNIGSNIGRNIRSNILENIGENIWSNIGSNIRSNIRSNIGSNILGNIGSNILGNIGENILENIGGNIWNNILENIRENNFKWVDTYSWCQHDINWIAYYKYFEKYGLLPRDKNFDIFNIWYDLACSCGWCYTFENIVFVCEKPCKLDLDEDGRLHSLDGMALEYSDGYGFYMIERVRVPRWIVESPEKIEIDSIQKESDLEVQRVMVNRYGVDRYLRDIDAKVVDYDLRGIEGGGARCLLREKNGNQWLVCTDGSTERVYHLSVSRNAKSCKGAHEELCGFSEKLIKMEG